MKSILFIISCFLVINSGFSQDTFTYKTVHASDTKERVIQLDEPDERITEALSKSLGTTSREGGTVTNGTLGALSVSPTGGANYTIPIDVPPGLNGVAPKISLSYNSQSGNSVAGWGWNLSGTSSITRIPSTQYHDNTIDPVDFDILDRFALDGQRLILRTGSYGANGAVYQTEKYSNIKIVSYGSHPTSGVQGPRYFKVFYPDGSIARYGYNSDSISYMDYAISYWENPQGIRINYNYSTHGEKLRLDKITYGVRGSSTPINEIEFVYRMRQRRDFTFVNGVLFRNGPHHHSLTYNVVNLLSKIIVRGNNTAYREYALIYSNTSLGYNRLEKVTEFTANNNLSRSAINFTYGYTENQVNESENTYDQLPLINIEQRNAKVITLDISGDGKQDFIVYPTTGTDAKKKFWLFSDFQQGGQNWGIKVNTGLFEDIFPVSWLNDQNKLLPNQGLAVIQNSGSTQVKFKVYS